MLRFFYGLHQPKENLRETGALCAVETGASAREQNLSICMPKGERDGIFSPEVEGWELSVRLSRVW